MYRLTLDGQHLTVLHSFSGADGGGPCGGLVQDAAGNFYGVTAYGGVGQIDDSGTAFRIGADATPSPLIEIPRTNGWIESRCAVFQPPANAQSALVLFWHPLHFMVANITDFKLYLVGAGAAYSVPLNENVYMTSNKDE